MTTTDNGETSVYDRLTIEQRIDRLEWCLAELMYKLKLATAQQLLSNPVVQEQLVAAIAAKIG